MNRCILMGNLTRDPEVSYSEKAQMSIARFTVAVDRIPKRDGEAEADFFNCVAFDRRAEFIEQYWHSGMRVLVSGRLQNDNYTNKKGEKVYGVSLKADEVEIAGGKREPDTGQVQNTAPSRTAAPARTADSGNTARASNKATPAPKEAAPSRGAGSVAGQPASGRKTAQRPASARSATGRAAAQRATRSASSDAFMNVASGIEEDLPFN